MPRIFPKIDGKLDSSDFGPMAHPPHILESQSGYEIHVFRGQDGVMDYNNIIAKMSIDDEQILIPNQELPPNTIWHFVRKTYSLCCCKYSDPSPPCIIMIDACGNMIGATPNAPTNLVAEPTFGGKIRLRWRYSRYAQEVPPTGFRIYMVPRTSENLQAASPRIIPKIDGRLNLMDFGPKAHSPFVAGASIESESVDNQFDFNNPIDEIEYQFRGEFRWTSDFLVNGQKYKFCVRSYRNGAGESQNTNFAAATADSEGPDPITVMQINWQEI